MPIKIFAAPGDHRDDFKMLEQQANEWMAETHPKVISMHCAVNAMPEKRQQGQFLLTTVIHYEPGSS